MKKSVSELELWEVDYLVAKAEFQELGIEVINHPCGVSEWNRVRVDGMNYSPTTNPSQAWPIIEREGICLNVGMLSHEDNSVLFWNAEFDEHTLQCGKTSLEAAMRCYVASKYGDEVEI